MICSELMSNKFDFNKVTFKKYVHQIVLNIWRPKLKKISKSTASQQGQLSPPQLQYPTSNRTSTLIVYPGTSKGLNHKQRPTYRTSSFIVYPRTSKGLNHKQRPRYRTSASIVHPRTSKSLQ